MKYAVMLLSFIVCCIISLYIIIHSYRFLSGLMDARIALMLALTVEVCFISYGILAVLLGKWTLTDSVIKVLLFIISVIPATMENSHSAREIVIGHISRAEPVAPQEIKNLIGSFDSRLTRIDEEVSALRKFKSAYDQTKSGRTWYAFQDQKRIDRLMLEREKIEQEKNTVQSNYVREQGEYKQLLQEYRAGNARSSFSFYFDLSVVIWSVITIWILQIVNGRLSSAISYSLATGKSEITDYLTAYKKELISSDVIMLFNKHKYPGLSSRKLKEILRQQFIFEMQDIKDFISRDYHKILRERYPDNIYQLISPMFEKIEQEIFMLNSVSNADNSKSARIPNADTEAQTAVTQPAG